MVRLMGSTWMGLEMKDDTYAMVRRIDKLEAALERIAAGRRPDNTYNLSRLACQRIAVDALTGSGATDTAAAGTTGCHPTERCCFPGR